MKKRILIYLTLSFTVLLFFLISCSHKNLPVGPTEENPGSGATNLLTPNAIVLSHTDLTQINKEDKLWFTFPFDMDSASIVANITVFDTTNNQNVTGNIIYLSDVHQAYFEVSDTFPNDAVFIVRILSNIQSLQGGRLDGNGNDTIDGSPYDDYIIRLYRGNPSTSANSYDITPPKIDLSNTTPRNGNVSINTNIILSWNGFVDSSTVTNNFYLQNSQGQTVNCSLSLSANSATLYPIDSLNYNELYTVTVNASSITDTANHCLIWGEYAWTASVPDLVWDFHTEGDTATDAIPLHLNSANSGTGRVEVVFDDTLDQSSVNTDRVYIINNLTKEIYTDGEIVFIDNDRFYYIHPVISSIHDLSLVILKEITDDAGNLLDGNGNNIGGEEADPDRWDYEASDDIIQNF